MQNPIRMVVYVNKKPMFTSVPRQHISVVNQNSIQKFPNIYGIIRNVYSPIRNTNIAWQCCKVLGISKDIPVIAYYIVGRAFIGYFHVNSYYVETLGTGSTRVSAKCRATNFFYRLQRTHVEGLQRTHVEGIKAYVHTLRTC